MDKQNAFVDMQKALEVGANESQKNVSLASLSDYQLAMLNYQMEYVKKKSRFYASHLSGFTSSITNLCDFSGFPFTTAEDTQMSAADFVCVSAGQVERIVTIRSTGSSGMPKRLYFTKSDLERTIAFFRTGMGYLCSPGDTAMILMPSASAYSIGRLLNEGLERLGAKPEVIAIGADNSEMVASLRNGKPHTIVGIPAMVRKLALLAPDIRPANVLLSADYISMAAKETISRIWGCEVFEHFGMTETGYGCAVECPAHQGQHIRHDEFLIEIVDPDGIEPVAYGEWGEIVITTFRREAMPLIRYRTGDIGRLIREPCPCGSVLPRLDRVLGRKAELAKRPNIYEMDELLLQDDRILDYQASLADGTMTVMLEARSDSVNNGAGDDIHGGIDEGNVKLSSDIKRTVNGRWPDIAVRIISSGDVVVHKYQENKQSIVSAMSARNEKRSIKTV